jgi:hypothetical protein
MLAACTSSPAAPAIDAGPVEDASSGTPAHPGVCFGAKIRCEAPVFDVVDLGTPSTVTCTDGPDLPVLWTAPLGDFDCFLPNCPSANPRVKANGARYWAVAEIRMPYRDTDIGTDVVGFAAFAFDGSGQQVFAAASDRRARIAGPLGLATRAIGVDANGSLHWAAPAGSGHGVELRSFGADGTRLATRLAVRGALPDYGDATWFADGSAVVTYRYPDPASDGGPDARLFPGVARFDPHGRLVWNQTSLSLEEANDRGVVSAGISIAGVTPRSGVVIRQLVSRASDDYPNLRFIALDADGNTVWGKEYRNASAMNGSYSYISAQARVLPDGTTLFAYNGGSRDAGLHVAQLDPDGYVMGATAYEGNGRGSEVAFAPGYVFLPGAGFGPVRVDLIDLSTGKCLTRSLPGTCLPHSDGGQAPCDATTLDPLDTGELFFGAGRSVGVARWR